MVTATAITFIQRAVMQGIPLLYGSTGEIITEKSGNLNLGIPGIMYVGGISGVIGAFLYENSLDSVSDANGFLAVIIPLLCSVFGSLLMGLIYCFLTVTLRANQNVTGLAITTFGTGFGNFFGGSLIKLTGADVPSVALTTTSNFFRTTLPGAKTTGAFGQIFLSYGFLAYAAIIIAILCAIFLSKTRGGLHLRAVGENPATADAAGINVERSKYLATCIGGGICGLGGLYIVMNSANGTGGVWVYNSISGYGWLAVAIVIFCTWSPAKAVLCSLIVGALTVMRYYYQFSFIPSAIYEIFPYIATVVVLVAIIFRKKKNNLPPSSLGLAYFREER